MRQATGSGCWSISVTIPSSNGNEWFYEFHFVPFRVFRGPSLQMSFILKMAWRDTRASRRRLLLYSLSIVLGVAALIVISSLGDNLRAAVDTQAKGLLAADLSVSA